MPKRIVSKLTAYPSKNGEVFDTVFAAYNRFCEDENNGNGYIFNINNAEDLKFLVQNECINAAEIAKIYNDSQFRTSGLFFFDENHMSLDESQIGTWEEVRDMFIDMIDDLCTFVLTYATRCKEYQAVYEMFVTDLFLEYQQADALCDKKRFNCVCCEIGLDYNTDLDALAALKRKLEQSES